MIKVSTQLQSQTAGSLWFPWFLCDILITYYQLKLLHHIMKLFKKNIPAEKIGNFILTVITAFVSTFLMQSCMSL